MTRRIVPRPAIGGTAARTLCKGAVAACAVLIALAPAVMAQSAAPAPAGVAAPAKPAEPETPPDYVIGPDDILSIMFWRDKDMTTDVVVRPDGKITLPVLNEIRAAGLTPEQLRADVLTAATKFFEAPVVSVSVKQINSRKVFVMGEVAKPGPYPLSGKLTVLQMIAMAGGLNEFAKGDKIAVIRTEQGQPKRYRVNYNDIVEGKNLRQNIELAVGDTIVVP
ncbi:MAG: polysaccharide biosynthesis/export family protein [Acidobacteria bacterium]|nr:polysaccharide biosynthesis/export family protein [Acidobacteriota bacterium]